MDNKSSDREHAEFHNCYTEESVKQDIEFLKTVYKKKPEFIKEPVNRDFINQLKRLGKKIYFFLLSLEKDVTPQSYIRYKYEFIKNYVPDRNIHLFFLAWNGLIKNDSFKRLLLQKFSLNTLSYTLCPKHIPDSGSANTRYRTKLVLAESDMDVSNKGVKRTSGRKLDDGSGLEMSEGIVWLPNGKGVPLYPQAYVPVNQTHVILIRHGRSIHESGGKDPEFVGSGFWDIWDKNKRVSGSQGNSLKPEGIETARELGRDFKVITDLLSSKGYPLWSWSKDRPISVFGSESENTEQTARYFLNEAGYSNLSFDAVFGLNSQKYGALTYRKKNSVFKQTGAIYFPDKDELKQKEEVKKMFKNRFFHFPEGETLIEADWRIAFSFIELLRNNMGRRIVLADHSGAIRVFEAIIRTLDFADYCTIKEGQDSIMALCYQPGRNVRYDYLQKADSKLR